MSEKGINVMAEELNDEQMEETAGGAPYLKRRYVCPKCRKEYKDSLDAKTPKCPFCGQGYYDRIY